MPAATSRKDLHQHLFVLMEQALQTEIGLEVSTSDANRLRSELNFARRAAREFGNNEFNSLIFRICPNDPERRVWIVRKHNSTSASPEEGES